MGGSLYVGANPTRADNYLDGTTTPWAEGNLIVTGSISGYNGILSTIAPPASGVTSNGFTVTPPAITLSGGITNGINVGNITTSGGTDTAINIGTGWDTAFNTTLSAAGQAINIDAVTTPSTIGSVTSGVIDLNVSTSTNLNAGLNIDYNVTADIAGFSSRASAAVINYTTADVTLQSGSALYINQTAASTTATGSLIKLENLNTTQTVVNGIYISTAAGKIQNGIQIVGTTGLTTQSAINLNSYSYNHITVSEIVSLVNIAFSDVSTNALDGGTTNGINIAPTINTTGAGTKIINGINIATPITNTCTTGACTRTAINIGTGWDNAITGNGFLINGSGQISYTANGSSATAVCNNGGYLATCTTSGVDTLQSAYGNDVDGSDTIIALTTGDDSLIFRNPSSSGTDSGYILSLDQLAAGAVDALRISQAGTGKSISLAKEQNHTIGVEDTTVGTAGGNLTLKSGAGLTTGAGGTIALTAGRGGATSGIGGAVTVTAGAGGLTTGTGAGGAITLTTGAGGDTSGASGNLTLRTGTTTSGASGLVSILSGTPSGAGASGDVGINVGAGSPNGSINIGATNSPAGINIGTGTTTTTTPIILGNTGNTSAITHNSGVVSGTGASSAFAFSDTALTSGTGINVSGPTALTSGSLLSLNTATYVHTALNDIGSLVNLAFSDTSTNANNGGVTNGILITPTIATTGAGTKTINGINIVTPITNTCTTGACTRNAINIGTGWDQALVATGAPIASTTAPMVQLGSILNGSASGTYLGISSGAFTGNYVDIQKSSTSVFTLKNTGAIVQTLNAEGLAYDLTAASNGAFDVVRFTANNLSIGSLLSLSATGLTSGAALYFSGAPTALTNGSLIRANLNNTYNHTAAQTGSLVDLKFIDASNPTTNIATTTNGINIASTVNVTGSGSANGIRTINAINVAAPALTACNAVTTQTCVWSGLNIAGTTNNTSTITENGINIAGITGGTSTETAISIGAGWDNSINSTGTLGLSSSLTTGTAVKIGQGVATTLSGAYTGLNVDLDTNYTPGANNRTGINVAALTSGTGTTETAINIGTGWDSSILFATGADHLLKVAGATAANTTGNNITLAGSTGTGNNAGGSLIFQTAPKTSPAIDATNICTASATSTAVSCIHTLNAGNNRLLVFLFNFPGNDSISVAPTYGGSAMTRLGTGASSGAGAGDTKVEIYYFLDNTGVTGSRTASATLATSGNWTATVMQFNNVNQNAGVGATNTFSTTNSITCGVSGTSVCLGLSRLNVASPKDELIVDIVAVTNTSGTPTVAISNSFISGQTSRSNITVGTTTVGATSTQPGNAASNQTLWWSLGNPSTATAVEFAGSIQGTAATSTTADTLSERIRIDQNGSLAFGTGSGIYLPTPASTGENGILFAGGVSTTSQIKVQDSTSGSGGSLAITGASAAAANPLTSTLGGSLTLTGGAGNGVNISSSGGSISLTGGAAGQQNSGGTGVGVGGGLTLVGGLGGVGGGQGGSLTFTGGTINGTGTGGQFTWTTGAGGNTSGASGAINLKTGTTTSGTSGLINILSGNPTSGASGVVTLGSGNAAGSFASGTLTLQTGTTTAGNTGTISLNSGNATGGSSGGITIGSGTTSGSASGAITISSGTATSSTSGDITLSTGSGTTAGNTIFKTGNVEEARFASTGNLGIGTTTPQATVTLSNTSSLATELAPPTSPGISCSSSGGSMADGTYYFKVTSADDYLGTNSTTPSSEVSCTISSSSGNGSVQISWTAAYGAQGYRVYKGNSSNGEDRYKAAGSSPYTWTTDTGATVAAVPSTTNAYLINLAGASGYSQIFSDRLYVTGTTSANNGIWFGADGGALNLQRDASGLTTPSGFNAASGMRVGPGFGYDVSSAGNLLIGSSVGPNTLSIGTGGAIGITIDLAGGSGATGCTVAGATGNLTCSGTITGSGSFLAKNAADTSTALVAGGNLYSFQNTSTTNQSTGLLLTTPNVTSTLVKGIEVDTGTVSSGIQKAFFASLGIVSSSGTAIGYDVTIATPTGGTVNGFNIQPVTSNGGSVNGINIGAHTKSGAGTETAINIGTGWDNQINATGFTVSGIGATSINTGASLVNPLLLTTIANVNAIGITANNVTSTGVINISATGLTTGSAIAFSPPSTLTTGGFLNASGNNTYIHTTAETGSLVDLKFIDASTNNNVSNSITNGINIATTINTTGQGTKAINAINIAAPTITQCTTGACTKTAINIGTGWDTSLYLTNSASQQALVLDARTNPTSLAGGTNLCNPNTSLSSCTGVIDLNIDTSTAAAPGHTGINLDFHDKLSSGTGQQIAFRINLTKDTATGASLYGGVIRQANATTIGAYALLGLDNASSSVAAANGLTLSSGAGRITSGINFSSGNFDNYINISAPTGSATTAITGLNIANLSSAGAADENAIKIGTGWDYSINAGGISSTHGFTAQNLSQNFGALAEAGGFVSHNSYFGEEFTREYTDITADTAQVYNDFAFDEETVCVASTVNDTVNGIALLAPSNASSCSYYTGTNVAGTAHKLFDADNLPVVLMKVRPSGTLTDQAVVVGLADATAGATALPNTRIVFSNINAAAASANWYGTVFDGVGTEQFTASCGAISTTQFALLKIVVTTNTSVSFYIDTDVSNGVSFTLCGTLTSEIPVVALNGYLNYGNTAGTAGSLGIDFFRVWQDDSAAVEPQIVTDTPVDPIDLGTGQPSQPIVPTLDLVSRADIAENYQAEEGSSLEPGDLVSINLNGKVQLSSGIYDQKLLGIISTSPAQTLGNNSDNQTVRVALAGRVPTKVSTENGVIAVGDPLTSSSNPGLAMKATKSGPIIGKALESFTCDPDKAGPCQGKILVFVQGGYWAPPLNAGLPTSLTGMENITTADLVAINITAVDLNVSNSINIGGKITLDKDGKLTVNGEIIVAGKITLTGDINISGKVDADVVAANEFKVKTVTNDPAATAGSATILAGTKELIINTTKVAADSLVFVTPTTQTDQQLAVVEKIAGTSFKVKLNSPATEDITFNWIIVNQQISQGN